MFKIFQKQDEKVVVDSPALSTPVATTSKTFFGLDLDILLERDSKEGRIPMEEARPYIYQKLIEFLMTSKVITTEGLFRVPGSSKVIKEYRDIIEKTNDFDSDIKDADVHAIAAVFKTFFRELPNSLIPMEKYSFFEQIDTSSNNALDVMKRALSSYLTQPNRKLLGNLLHFLAYVCSYEQENKMSITNIVVVFGPNLLFNPESRNPKTASPEKLMEEQSTVSRIVTFLLGNVKELFPDCGIDQPLTYKRNAITSSKSKLFLNVMMPSEMNKSFSDLHADSLLKEVVADSLFAQTDESQNFKTATTEVSTKRKSLEYVNEYVQNTFLTRNTTRSQKGKTNDSTRVSSAISGISEVTTSPDKDLVNAEDPLSSPDKDFIKGIDPFAPPKLVSDVLENEKRPKPEEWDPSAPLNTLAASKILKLKSFYDDLKNYHMGIPETKVNSMRQKEDTLEYITYKRDELLLQRLGEYLNQEPIESKDFQIRVEEEIDCTIRDRLKRFYTELRNNNIKMEAITDMEPRQVRKAKHILKRALTDIKSKYGKNISSPEEFQEIKTLYSKYQEMKTLLQDLHEDGDDGANIKQNSKSHLSRVKEAHNVKQFGSGETISAESRTSLNISASSANSLSNIVQLYDQNQADKNSTSIIDLYGASTEASSTANQISPSSAFTLAQLPDPISIETPESENFNPTMEAKSPKVIGTFQDIYESLKIEKKALQIELHKYQNEFQKRHGRPVASREDREPILDKYIQYKDIKKRIALLESTGGSSITSSKLALDQNSEDD